MALKMKKQVAVPDGTHRGIITACEETTKTFDPAKGPEAVVEVVIQPEYKAPEGETLPVSFTFSPSLNGLSGLSRFLAAIGHDVADGEEFEPSSICGTQVEFVAKRNAADFVQVVKTSVRAAPTRRAK